MQSLPEQFSFELWRSLRKGGDAAARGDEAASAQDRRLVCGGTSSQATDFSNARSLAQAPV